MKACCRFRKPDVQALKVIPVKQETMAYFAVQQVVLVVTLSAAMAGTVYRYRSKQTLDTTETEAQESRKSETWAEFSLTVFVHFVLPVLDMLPSVYIWYDYNMSRELTYDQSTLISAVIFAFVLMKVFFLLMRIVMLNAELNDPQMTKSRNMAKKLLFGGVKGGPLQFILIDSFEPFLLYFYFNRYLAPAMSSNFILTSCRKPSFDLNYRRAGQSIFFWCICRQVLQVRLQIFLPFCYHHLQSLSRFLFKLP